MLWHWIVAAVAFIAIPIVFSVFPKIVFKGTALTKAQKKQVNLSMGKYIFLFWLYDFLYIAIFNNNLTCIFILGIIATIIIFTNLTKGLISDNRIIMHLLPFDLVLGVLLSVYLIYIIPDTNLQTIVTAIIAALYGGILTLVGVAWTIQHTNKERKEAEKNAIKPILYSISHMVNYDYKESADIIFSMNGSKQHSIFVGVIKNTDNGILIIKEAIVNGIICPVRHVTVLDKNTAGEIRVWADEEIKIETMIIIGTDVQGNITKYELHLLQEKHDIEYVTEIVS